MNTDNLSNLTQEDPGKTGISVAGPAGEPAKKSGNSSGSGDDRSQEPGPRLIERRTGLRGQSIAPGRRPVNPVRKNTLDDLNERDPEVPYMKAERAQRDLVCSILERQDRMNEEILARVIDLQYRMDDLEEQVQQSRKRKSGTGAEVSS